MEKMIEEIIDALRKAQGGCSELEFCLRNNLKQPTYNRIINGKSNPRLSTLMEYAKVAPEIGGIIAEHLK